MAVIAVACLGPEMSGSFATMSSRVMISGGAAGPEVIITADMAAAGTSARWCRRCRPANNGEAHHGAAAARGRGEVFRARLPDRPRSAASFFRQHLSHGRIRGDERSALHRKLEGPRRRLN